MPAAASRECFHCGLPVPRGPAIRARVLDVEREFCCRGCEAVAGAIEAGGFGRYYESRTAPARQATVADTAEVDAAAESQCVSRTAEGEVEATLVVDGMTCAACGWLAESALARVRGVVRAEVNVATRRARVAWKDGEGGLADVVRALRTVGYDAWPWDPARAAVQESAERKAELWRLFVAAFGAMQVMMYALPGYLDGGATMSAEAESAMRWAGFLITLPVLLISCRPFFASAWRELRARRLGLDTPIALGIAGGFLASAWATVAGKGDAYFDSIAMLAFLLLAARWAQSAARRRASREMDRLLRWSPAMAARLEDPDAPASMQRIAAHALRSGDYALVSAGERIPADGVVARGSSSVDESLLTGESRPVRKLPGAPLTGGAVNLEQPLVMQVTRAGRDAWAAGIARLVERAAATRPDLLPAADRVARAFTGVVLLVALAAFAAWWQVDPARAPWIAVAVLVATCPCALALAAPVALAAASARLLQQGIVMTNPRAVQALAGATDIVFDKTGTLTQGRFALAHVRTHGARSAGDCLALAAGLEAASRHPIARVFQSAAVACEATDLRDYPGRGVQAFSGGARVRIGSLAFCGEIAGAPAPVAAFIDEASRTQVHLAREGAWLASFSLEDRARPGMRALLQGLRAAGLRVHLLSGDREATVAALAGRLGIAAWEAQRTPRGKLAYVEQLQAGGATVAMVGDGLNDAPVLARADCGIAVAGGADAAQLRADLVLLGEGTAAVAIAIAVARRTMAIVRQNLGWALAYNALALPLAAAGAIGPWEAALGMSASSLLVAVNALRVLRPAGAGVTSWNRSPSSSPFPSRSSS